MDQTQTLLLLLHNARLLEKKVVYNCLFLETKFWQFLHLICIAPGLSVHGVLTLSRCHSLMSLVLHLPSHLQVPPVLPRLLEAGADGPPPGEVAGPGPGDGRQVAHQVLGAQRYRHSSH